jgi:hemolysin D
MGDNNRSREMAAFLPAALEIQEAPPHPLARYLSWSLIGLVVLGVTWASLGHVNIVASAEGKIIPSGRVKVVQPSAGGVVKRILVSEGDTVTIGQPLIELDAVLTVADQNRLASEIDSLSQMISVNQAFLDQLNLPLEQQMQENTSSLLATNMAAAYAKEGSLHAELLRFQWRQYWSERQALYRSLDIASAEKSMTLEVISKLEQTLPIAVQRASNLNTLLNQSFIAETDYLSAEQTRIQVAQDLAAERHRIRMIVATEFEVQERIETHIAQTQRDVLSTLVEQQRQLASLREEMAKAEDLNGKRVLYAPVSGQIQQLQVTTEGGVVTEAQQLMLIVPSDELLEAEVFLKNDDIGYISQGMLAEIKVQTFPFTKYGVVDAEVLNVSRDAIVDEKRGLIYSMQLRLARNALQVDGTEAKLIPGMAVTAEVQIGERRIIEFFLSPLLRHKEEALRER